MSSPPQQTAAVPPRPANSGASGVPSVARAAMLFLTTTTWMFFAAQIRPQPRVGVGVQADHVHQQGVVDVLQPVAEVFGNQILDVFAHVKFTVLVRVPGAAWPRRLNDRHVSITFGSARWGSSWR